MQLKIGGQGRAEAFASEIRKVQTNDDARMSCGTRRAIMQAKDLIAHNVPCLHIYTYGLTGQRSLTVKAVF